MPDVSTLDSVVSPPPEAKGAILEEHDYFLDEVLLCWFAPPER